MLKKKKSEIVLKTPHIKKQTFARAVPPPTLQGLALNSQVYRGPVEVTTRSCSVEMPQTMAQRGR
jgi:hypothetical protein